MDLSDFDSRPEPDIAWVKAGRYVDAHPRAEHVLLLIVVSGSSLAFDLFTKAELYSKAAIPEYWIVDVGAMKIRVHRHPKQDRYREISTFGEQDKLSPQFLDDAFLDLRTLFVGN